MTKKGKFNSALALKITKTLAGALIIFMALMAINLLLIGVENIVVLESTNGEASQIVELEKTSYRPAIFPLISTLLMGAGLWWRRQVITWSGFGILLIFSLIFMFSSGAFFLLLGVFLFVLLLLINRLQ